MTFAEVLAEYQAVTYEDLARHPEEYKGELVTFRAEIVEVAQQDETTLIARANITQGTYYWTDDIFVYWKDYGGLDLEGRILEDDLVRVYGTGAGLFTYETVLGASRTIPLVNVDYLIQ